MNSLMKKAFYFAFILMSLFNQNLSAHVTFSCDFVRDALVWDVGTLHSSEIDGTLIPIKESPLTLMEDNCNLLDMGRFSVTIKMTLPLIKQGTYKLPNGLELINTSTTWSAHIKHWIGTIANTEWLLYPDIESKNFWGWDAFATYRAIMRGTLIYRDINGRAKDGPFNIKIGEAALEYGPSVPIYIYGNLQEEHKCSIVTKNIMLNMPSVKTTAFHGINSSTGETPVTVDINCSQNMPDISIHLNSPHAINSQQGILPPSLTSTTKGIAIQLLDQQGNPIDFSKNIKSMTVDDRFHRIIMKARYIQTEKTIKMGTLKSNIRFDVEYQ